MNTVLPEPDCPMMRFVFPVSKVAEMSWSTRVPSNHLDTFLASIIAAGV